MNFSLRKLSLAAALLASCATFAETVTTLWEDDFEWLADWSAWKPIDGKPTGDAIGNNDHNSEAKQLSTPYIGSVSEGTAVTAYQALLNKGYEFMGVHSSDKGDRTPNQQIYLQKNYLKFGLTGYYSGISIPVTQAAANDAFVEFDWCSQRQNSGKYDATKLVVIVKNGDNEMQFPVPFKQYETNAVMHWTHEKIKLEGATVNADTRIVIRNADEQWPAASGALRYYLDNIKITDVNPLDIITSEDFEWFGTPASNGRCINDCPEPTFDEVADNNPGAASEWSSSQYYGLWPSEEHPEYRYITAYDKMVQKGYEMEYVKAAGKGDRKHIGSTVYIMKNYVKFGLTGYQAGISFPAYSSVDGTAIVSFDWCPQSTKDHKTWDAVELVVIVRNGNNIKKTFAVPAANMASGEALRWIHVEMPLEGVEINKGDFIQIRHADNQWPDARALRWYFDNFKLMGKSKGDADTEIAAPKLYLKGDINNWTANEESKFVSNYEFNLLDEVTYTFEVPSISGEILISTEDGAINIGKSDADIEDTEKSYVLAYGDTKLKVPTLENATLTLTYFKDSKIAPRIIVTGTTPVAPVTGERKAYAYDLKANTENGKLNVSYKSTANAKSAALLLFPEEGDAIVRDLPAPVKGLNEAAINIDDIASGSYTWQINIVSELEGDEPVVAYRSPAEWMPEPVNGGVVWIRDPQSPAYGYTVVSIGKAGGFVVYNPEGELVTEAPVHKGFAALDASNARSASCGDAIGGLAAFSDWSFASSGAWVIDPLNPSAEPYNMFMAEGATRNTANGIISYNGTELGSGSPTVAFQGEGDDTKLFYFEESLFGNTLVRYDLGSDKYVTKAPSLVMSSYKNLMINTDIEVETLSEGFFVSQTRNDFNNSVYGLMYFNDEGEMLWHIANKGVLPDTNGHSISSGVAVNSEESRLALSGYDEIYVFDLAFNANGEPELTNPAIYPIAPSGNGTYRMQLVFDAADNLHVFSTRGQGYSVIVLPGETTASTSADEALVLNTTGIENINTDKATPAEYYNIHGFRVDGSNLTPGIYIRRQGAETSKIIVR